MPALIFFIFVFVWYFPVWKMQGKEGRLKNYVLPISILIGALPVIGLTFVTTIFLSRFTPMSLPYAGRLFYRTFISVAFVEESFKLIGALIVILIFKPKRKIDYVLIFGAVGMGFEITESFMDFSNIISGVIRGLFALHIIWQMWMGMYFYEFIKAKERKLPGKMIGSILLFFILPFLIHGANDFLVDYTVALMGSGESDSAVMFIVLLILFSILEIVYQIITYRKALRISKESRNIET